jgi:GDP-L-fucose synthase
MTMDILLLGADGFAGRNVSDMLQNNEVNFAVIKGKTECDLRNREATLAYFKKINPKLIINCAAHVGSLNYVTEKAATVISDNTLMIDSIYFAISQINTDIVLINPIANCAYPATADTFKEDEWWNGHLHRSVLSYGSTRRMLWSYGESYFMQYRIKSINLLVPNMYGSSDSTDPNKAHALNALISKFVKADLEGKAEIEIWGTGIAIREWLYAKDFAKIVLEIIKNPEMVGLSQPINIAQNFGLSVTELVSIINKYFNNKFTIKWDANMPDGAPKKVMDDLKFKKVFPEFKFTDFDLGIRETINYYQSVYPY